MKFQQPNVLFILSDDQGPWAMGCAGNDEIRTPNLDRLAAGGMRMSNFFCTSPVCSPARASILTGRIPSQHGVHDWLRDRDDWYLPGHDPKLRPPAYLDEVTCVTDLLAEAGYVCGLSGKWHLGDSLMPQHGFTHWFCHPKGGGTYNDMHMIRDGRIVETEGYVTDVITDDALTFLDRAVGGSQPFYLSVHYTAPHSPWEGHPQDIVDSYDDCPFASCPQEPMHPWATGLWISDRCLGDREMLKGYFAAVTAMDANIGRLLDRLDALGVAENTLVVFMSDNGFSCGHHGFWGKGNGTRPLNMYENSVKVPAIFRHPGRIAAGKVCDALLSQYDVLPTLLAHAGLPEANDPSLPGVSFAEVLAGRADEARDDVVIYDEYGPVRMIRTRQWKYIHRHPDGPNELYDLQADPDERKNLVAEESHQATVEELAGRLEGWFQQYITPSMDGHRCPATGYGQLYPVDQSRPDNPDTFARKE